MKNILLLGGILLMNHLSFTQIMLDSTEIEERIVVENLEVPWDMTYGADGWIWFTELNGRVSRFHPDTEELQFIYQVNGVEVFGFSAGMHSIVLHPDFEETPYVFVHFMDTQSTSKIVRFVFDPNTNTLIDYTNILTNIPGGASHNGSRMIIDGAHLFIALGDSFSNPSSALDFNAYSGKFLRMNLDGSVPDDNPIAGSLIWSWGHRNPQGFCQGNGYFYSAEHGTSTDDEINIIEGNRNYGWPAMEGTCDMADEEEYCETENVKEPIWTWTPAIAPCGLEFYDHEAIPEWQNSLLVAVLKNRQLIQLKLNEEGTEVIEQNIFLDDTYGRLRDVLTIPDGRIFISTTNRDYAGNPSFGNDKIIELKSTNELVNTENTFSVTDLKLYPNPAQHTITINRDAGIEGELTVTDMNGKTVYKDTVKSTRFYKLNVEEIGVGIFYLRLIADDVTYSEKFMVIPN